MRQGSLAQYLQDEKDKKENAIATLIGYCIYPFVTGWLFVWYNYVLLQYPIGYWQLTLFATGTLLVPKWLTRPVFGIVFTIVLFAQIAKWTNLLTLPIIK